MSLFLDYIRTTECYKALCQVHDSNEGNTLELIDDTTAEAQVEFHRWALGMVRAENPDGIEVLEIGTNKGMFGLLLLHLDPLAGLYTIDVNPLAEQAVNALCKAGLDATFECGPSHEVLPTLHKGYAYAWVDGHHGSAEAFADLQWCNSLQVPWVAVDDTVYPTVSDAITTWLSNAPYEEVLNPFLAHDLRQARLYRRVS
jgi:Methyltransferase domain